MDFMDLLRLLAWYAGDFVVLGAIHTLLAAGAYRLNLGAAPFPLDTREFWWRSALTGFALAAYTAVAFFFSLILVSRTAYLLFGIFMIPYLVLAVYLYSWAYALDDLLEGFKIFLIHHLLPFAILIFCVVFSTNVAGFLKIVAPSL